jgi:flagellin
MVGVAPVGGPQDSAAFSLALARLASGQRITKAADDAAGLAISQGMTSQIDELQQRIRNEQDSYHLDQTKAGYQASNQDALQQMRQLAVQAGNDLYGKTGRGAIQAVEDQLSAYLSNQAPEHAMDVSVDVTSSGGAGQALNALDTRIQDTSTAQARLGAEMNGLTHQIASQTAAHQNLSASRSTIQDADMAQESTALSAASVRQQLGYAAVASYDHQQSTFLTLL